MLKFALIIIVIFTYNLTEAQHKVIHAFNLAENHAVIEGMSFDPVGKHFYFGESTTKRLLRYTIGGEPAGNIDGAKDGMTSVLGSTVDVKNHHLWVCGATDTGSKKRMCMFQYDLKKGTLIKKLPDTSGNAKLFNDVAITASGLVFVTDSYTKTIYTADKPGNIMIPYIESDQVRDPNGISANGDTLYVSTSRGIMRITTADKKITPLPLAELRIAGIDGLYYYKNAVIGIQNVFYPACINRYHINNADNMLSKAEILSCGHPTFVIPTTGAIVNDEFYFMSNNNLGKEQMSNLQPVSVEKISLKN